MNINIIKDIYLFVLQYLVIYFIINTIKYFPAWAEAGLFPVSDLTNLRKIDSDLEGHPTPRLNFIDVGTGSLGQGLSVACGMAYVGKYFDKSSYR